ncbi:MAG: MFS transporter, partial [Kutzneria sp.]|nr:MFS transporter [Kutzneria sp.]
ALSVLVFERTDSAGLTALTYALTFLPDLVSGPLLSGIADRYPRRTVMIVSDLGRAALVAVMAVPGLPFVPLCLLLIVVQAAGAPFNAARAATLAAALDGDRYVVGTGATDMVDQFAQVVGFAGGGALLVVIGPAQGLLIDSATFLGSAVLVAAGVARRPVPRTPHGDRIDGSSARRSPSWWRSIVAGAVLVGTDCRLRALVALACVAGCYVTVEGVVAPYAAEFGGGDGSVGLLLAASPAGAVVGMWVVSRWHPETRLRLLGVLAVGACLPLVACVLRPGIPVTVALWALSGMASAYHMPARSAFVQAVPDHGRGQAFGLAATALRTAQGTGVVMVGLAAEWLGPSGAVAGAGMLGTVLAGAAGLAWQRAR